MIPILKVDVFIVPFFFFVCTKWCVSHFEFKLQHECSLGCKLTLRDVNNYIIIPRFSFCFIICIDVEKIAEGTMSFLKDKLKNVANQLVGTNNASPAKEGEEDAKASQNHLDNSDIV